MQFCIFCSSNAWKLTSFQAHASEVNWVQHYITHLTYLLLVFIKILINLLVFLWLMIHWGSNKNFGQFDRYSLLCIPFSFLQVHLGIPFYSVLVELPLPFPLYPCVGPEPITWFNPGRGLLSHFVKSGSNQKKPQVWKHQFCAAGWVLRQWTSMLELIWGMENSLIFRHAVKLSDYPSLLFFPPKFYSYQHYLIWLWCLYVLFILSSHPFPIFFFSLLAGLPRFFLQRGLPSSSPLPLRGMKG